MVRRTKEDALATRDRLLDAAEHLFQEKGVSRTSLNEIALAAGATRGAIYWHFKDKADLFNAMMERVTLPLEESAKQLDHGTQDPIENIRASMHHALRKLTEDPQARRVFDIATHKVEYVDEMVAVRERHLRARDECLVHIQGALLLAARRRGKRLPMPAVMAAHGLHAIVDGLIQNWLLSPDGFNLLATGQKTVDAYLGGLGLMSDVTVAGAAASPGAAAVRRSRAATPLCI